MEAYFYKAIVFEIQQVTLEPIASEENNVLVEKWFTEQVKDITKIYLMEENYQKGRDLIMTYEDTGIFSEDDNDVVYTNRVQHSIYLSVDTEITSMRSREKWINYR